MNENSKFSERLLKNTQELVFLYNTNGKFKELFDKLVAIPKITFKGQTLRTYVKVITTISPRYHHFEKEIRQSSAKYGELLTSYYKDQREYPKLLQNLADIKTGKYNLPFSQEELRLMQELEKMPDDNARLSAGERQKKEEIIIQIHRHLDQTAPKTSGLTDIIGQPLKIYIPSVSVPHINIPPAVEGVLKTGASKAQITTGSFLKRTLPKVLSGTGRGILSGLGLGGKAAVGLGVKAGLLATGVGAPIAAVLMAPTIVKASTKIIKYTAIGVGAILLYFLFSDVNTTGSIFSPGSVGEAAILPPGGEDNITDILSCPLKNSQKISCGSYGSNYSGCPGGHCSTSYGTCPATEIDRLKHSIDVPANKDAPVFLPTIDGKKVTWTFGGANSIPDEGTGGGSRFLFNGNIDGDNWTLYLTHVNPSVTEVLDGQSNYQSGDAVATIYNNQLHVNISKNGVFIDPEFLGMCL